MTFTSEIKIGNGLAYFRITQENSGIYIADLIHSDSVDEYDIPENIVLTKGIRHWTGSCENQMLLNKLGELIDNQNRIINN